MGETVVDTDCRFTLPELAVVVVAVFKAESMLSTVLEAVLAALAFSVAAVCFALASAILALASSIVSSGFEVDPGDAVVVWPAEVGSGVWPSEVGSGVWPAEVGSGVWPSVVG